VELSDWRDWSGLHQRATRFRQEGSCSKRSSKGKILMEVALTLYTIFATVVVIWCSIPRTRPSVNYVTISRTMLNCLRQWNDDLVVVEVRGARRCVIQDALNVSPDQLPLLLRWIPPRTTIVLCGASEVLRCRSEVAMTLLRVGIEVVYVLEDDRHSSTAPTAPCVATPLL
jgi:hypothetical protein